MAQIKERDWMAQIDNQVDAFMARRWPRGHHFFRWYTEERLARIKLRAMYIGLGITAILVVVSYWRP